MKIYFDYMSHILKRCKKNLKDYILIQTMLVFLATVTSFIAIYLMSYSGGYKAALIIGVLDFIPIIGNGLYLVYQVMYNLVKSNVLISSNLAVLYLTILSVRLILEPIFLGRKLNFKVVLFFVISLVFRLLGGPKGLSMAALFVFILNTLISLNDIYTFDRKRKMKERREKRLRQKNKNISIENIEV